MRPTLAPLALLALPFLSGCLSELRPSDPPAIRWFQADVEVGEARPPVAGARTLRVEPVSAWRHLGERMVWRESEVEYGYYELDRWTEAPSRYLARAVDRKVFLEGAVPRAVGVGDLRMNLTLVAFEEDLTAEPAAVVAFHALVEGRDRVELDRMYTTRVAIEGEDVADVARALSRGLDALTDELAADLRALSAGGKGGGRRGGG